MDLGSRGACHRAGQRPDRWLGRDGIMGQIAYLRSAMDARDFIKVGMSAERTLTVTPDRTVRHVVPTMPAVFGTPMMIMEMEMASADAVNAYLQPGWVTVGTEVDIRHLAAAGLGAVIRTIATVTAVERRVIRFSVEAFEGERRIGDGRHARGLVNLASFNKRFGTG